MTTTLDLPELDRRGDLLPASELLTQEQPMLPWHWSCSDSPGNRQPCPSVTTARGLLASVGAWTWVNIDSGEEPDNPMTPRFVAQVLGDATRDKVMLEVHTFDDLYVVAREESRRFPVYEFPGEAAQIVSRCWSDEILPTAEMLNIAISWLCFGQIPDGYKLRPAHPAERMGFTC